MGAGDVITNERDTGRLWPTTALAPLVLTELEGAIFEKIVGPTNGGTRELSFAVANLVHIFAYTTATGAWSLIAENPVEGTDFSLTLQNANGVGEITELGVGDRSSETWLFIYRRPESQGTIGGVSGVSP